MSERNTLVRSMHDLGLAAWFGGGLMGAVGLNGAAAQAKDPTERLRLSSAGWARWAPVNAVAIGVHAIGGIGLIGGNKARLVGQSGSRANTGVKIGLTVAALAATVYSGVLGKTLSDHQDEGSSGTTEPDSSASPELAQAQQRLRWCQWAIPALTGALVVLGAQQGEQQRPLAGAARRAKKLVS